MESVTVVMWAVILCGMVLVVALMGKYNQLLRLRNEVGQAIGVLGIQYQSRFESQAPKGAEHTFKKQMEYLERILSVRMQMRGGGLQLGSALKNLPPQFQQALAASGGARFEGATPGMVVDAYVEAIQIMAGHDKDVAAARRFLESTVMNFNAEIITFPGNVVGAMAGMQRMEFQSVPAHMREQVMSWG